MNWRYSVLLFGLGFVSAWIIAQYQTLPGYMDADYYFAGGIQLATGKGFTEPYIWNYLSNPQTLPVPSHTYWMPLASMVSALGMWLTSSTSYAAGRFPFILLSACIPVLTASLTFRLTRTAWTAVTAGLLAVFSCYYAPFLPVTDNYALYMLLGGLFIHLLLQTQPWTPFALGVVAGLMTLARSDGLLWLGLAGLAVIARAAADLSWRDGVALLRRVVPGGLFALAGYFVIMGAWHYRTWQLFGAILTPGGGRLLWLQNYRETFVYPPEALTQSAFLQAGWGVALQNRLNALVANFETAMLAQGSLLLVPFILVGLWVLRRELAVRLALWGWLLLFFMMSVVFPFAGARGSFHHAGAALQPLWWAAAAIGMDALLARLRARGQFTDRFAPYVFQGMLIAFAAVFTVYLVQVRVVASGWARDDVIYASVEARLQENGISPMDVVIVPNPPGYYVRTGRSAIRLPTGDLSAVLAVAERFKAYYLVLQASDTLGVLQGLYDDPHSGGVFQYLGSVADARLYRIVPAP